MYISKNLKEEVKEKIKNSKGEIVSEHIELFDCQVDWENKKNQTRDSDYDRGHLAALKADIESRGMKNKPIVEFNSETGLYDVVSGFHRSIVQRGAAPNKDDQKLVFAEVKFGSNVDRELFMQQENDHPPHKPHTKKDAIRFIKSMRNHGYFDSANADTEVIKVMVDSLLTKHYCRMNSRSRDEVFHESFKDKKLTRVLTVLKNDIKGFVEKTFKKEKSFKWENDRYLCYGDPNNSRKSIAVALEKRVRMLDSGGASQTGARGKITVVTHFNSSSLEDLREQRKQFLETEGLLNKWAFGPGNVVIISDVCFMPQVDGKKGIKETKMIRYKWDFETREFIKS